jgi:hypothetical protein
MVNGAPDGANLRIYCAIQYPAECVALGFAGNGFNGATDSMNCWSASPASMSIVVPSGMTT